VFCRARSSRSASSTVQGVAHNRQRFPLKEVQPSHRSLWDHGYRNISVLDEGFPGWVKRGHPVER